MATFVLVAGSGQGGWCYQRVAPLLRAAGHAVYTPTLTGLCERAHLLSPDVDLDMHIDDVVGVLKFEGITNAILAGHSYGGMVITGVADRALSRVGHLVFLDAAQPRDGEALVDLSAAAVTRAQGRIVNGVELVILPSDDNNRLNGVTDPEDIAWMRDKVTAQPWKTYEQPLRLANEAAVWRIPRTIINCKAPLARRPPVWRDRAVSGERVWEIDTGHCLMISEPKATAEMLLRVAAL